MNNEQPTDQAAKPSPPTTEASATVDEEPGRLGEFVVGTTHITGTNHDRGQAPHKDDHHG